MADAYQVVLGLLVVSIMVLVPIGFAISYDMLADPPPRRLRAIKNRVVEAFERRRNLHTLRRQRGTSLERLATDLRRLRLAVSTDERRSAAHQLGNRMAYDAVLRQLCEMLDIVHELDTELIGLDRDIERLRVEAELERSGVMLTAKRYGQAA